MGAVGTVASVGTVGGGRRGDEAIVDPPVVSRRGPPPVVLAAAVALCLLGGLWSVLTPIAEGPDEPAHLGLVLHLADGHAYPDHDGLAHTDGTVELCRTYATSTRWCRTAAERAGGVTRRPHPADVAPGRSERARWGPEAARPVARRNQMPQHPPAAYQVLAAALRVERAVTGSSWPLDREVALLRLVGVALVAPLPVLAWWAARRAGVGDAVGSVAAVAVLAVPQLTATAATVGNDALLILVGAAVVALAAGVAHGDRRRRVGLALGLLCGLALLTKAFGVVFPPVVGLAYLVAARRTVGGGRLGWRKMVMPLLLAGVGTVAVAGGWYISRVASTGRLAPSIEDQRLGPSARPPGFALDPLGFGSDVVRLLVGRFWGSFGWFSVHLPLALCGVLTALALALGARGVASSSRRPRLTGTGRASAGVAGARAGSAGVVAVLLGPAVGLLSFVVVRAWALYTTSGQVAFLQGRYLFGGLTGLAVLAAAGAHRTSPGRALPAAAAVALALQGAALVVVVDGWWRVGGLPWSDAVRAVLAWGAWPAPVTALFALGTLAAAAVLARSAGRSSPRPPSSAG